MDNELNPRFYGRILIGAVPRKLDNLPAVLRLEMLPLRAAEEYGECLIVAHRRMSARITVLDHLHIFVVGTLRVCDGILHIFSDAVRDAAGTAAAQNKEQEREYQHQLFHRNAPLSKILNVPRFTRVPPLPQSENLRLHARPSSAPSRNMPPRHIAGKPLCPRTSTSYMR